MAQTIAQKTATARAMFGIPDPERGRATLEAKRKQLVKTWADDPWAFFIADDPETGKPLLWTRDERDEKNPVKSFPREKPYLETVVRELAETKGVVLVPKSRQMMISTISCLMILHDVIFKQARRNIISKVTEKGSQELLRDKIRFPWTQLPTWFKKTHPLSSKPAGLARATKTQSFILAVTEAAALAECRGGTAGIVLLDEMAYQDQSPEILEASLPMAEKIWCVSSPNVSGRGGRYMKSLVLDEEFMG